MTKKQVISVALLWMGLNSLFVLGCYALFAADMARLLCVLAHISSATAGMWAGFKWPLEEE